MKNGIQPTREQDFPNWYQQVIKNSDMAENSEVRGCMVIKPWGYSIWENMQAKLDAKFKQLGHKNAYFPLLIPLKNLEREAEHVAGFAKECAVVTHHKLVEKEGKLIPDGKLEEPYVIRPTSETIIGDCFANWISSYRDLPLCINQWANVMRWEMRTRLFLRTSEFLWQEGHTAHESSDSAKQMAETMIQTYKDFCENWLAIPVIVGEKTQAERFPGAVNTLCIEAMMQDKKALQAGTSHFLGQVFSKASNIKFTNKEGKLLHAWTTSWGVSTRLIGAVVMTHSDDMGLVLPPTIAPTQVVIIPVLRKNTNPNTILDACAQLKSSIEQEQWQNTNIRVEIDNSDAQGGKHWHWLKKGVPVIIEIGPKDIENQSVMLIQRDKKHSIKLNQLAIATILTEIQIQLFDKAKKYLQENTFEVDNWQQISVDKPGFYTCYAEDSEIMEQALKDTKLTARCIVKAEKPGLCVFSGKKTNQKIIFAKAY